MFPLLLLPLLDQLVGNNKADLSHFMAKGVSRFNLMVDLGDADGFKWALVSVELYMLGRRQEPGLGRVVEKGKKEIIS
ncbi:hypothetical protein ACJX0J_028625, partial [Zea mays]